MQLAGAIFTVLGLVISLWAINMQKKNVFHRPLGFSSRSSVIKLNLVWIAFVISGLYFFWRASPSIAIAIAAGLILIWSVIGLRGSERKKALKFFRIYKELLDSQPNANERDLRVKAARAYLESTKEEDRIIELGMKNIFKDKEDSSIKAENIINTAIGVLCVESSQYNFSTNKIDRTLKAINSAYKEVFPNE